jgi:hypothetical protein
LTWFLVEFFVFIVCDKLFCIGLVMERTVPPGRLFFCYKPLVPEIIPRALVATTVHKTGVFH